MIKRLTIHLSWKIFLVQIYFVMDVLMEITSIQGMDIIIINVQMEKQNVEDVGQWIWYFHSKKKLLKNMWWAVVEE